MLDQYKEELHYKNRCLRTQTGKLLFGPNGRRMNVDCMDFMPGFHGSIDFIHKMNITELFTVLPDIAADFSQGESEWYRTKQSLSYHSEEIDFWEVKTITEEDVAISYMEWTNCSKEPYHIMFRSAPEGFAAYEQADPAAKQADSAAESNEINKKNIFLKKSLSPKTRFEFRLGIVSGWNISGESMEIKPGETISLLAAAAIGNMDKESIEELTDKVNRCLSSKESPEKVITDEVKKKEAFYNQAPTFLSDDKRMNACWQYRWYILKNSLAFPEYGDFPGGVMYEGRDHRMPKTALTPKGWEFSKMIPLSTPLQVTDFRWFYDHETVKDVIRAAFAGQDEDGLLVSCYVNGSTRKSYANYMLWAIYLDYLVTPDKEFILELLPLMEKYISGHEKVYTDGKDSLLIETQHSLTGKEYQPSYWYFTDYPKNPKDKTLITPLKRVDRSIYQYLNLCGLSNLMDAVGISGSSIYKEKAETLKKDINDKMWDADTGYYYDLHYETEEKAWVKNIVGIYPYWAEIADEDKKGGMEILTDETLLATGSGFASVARDCPAFSPDGGWMGNFIKGRNGCVWCGPAWPYTTAIALDALAKESKKHDHIYDEAFDKILNQYTIQHFRDGDRQRPYIVEHYNPISGERLSDEADYNHSYYLDLIISHVAGVRVEADNIIIDPLASHLKWFRLDDLKIRGHRLSIRYAKDRDRSGLGIKKGLSVYLDEKEVASAEGQKKLVIKA